FRSRKALRLSWAEFRTEFLQKFNSTQIQSQLRADIVSVRQTPGQSLSDFVLIKNQQAHRVYTSLSEADLVGTIVELSLDKYCTQLILHRRRAGQEASSSETTARELAQQPTAK
ncbi:Retrotrans gag domain-containing protein, partial [Aphis craccivora]